MSDLRYQGEVKYYGEVLDRGRDFLTVKGNRDPLPIVTVKLNTGAFVGEITIDVHQARDMARHLHAAADAVIPKIR